jgi:peptidoglycan lytic transglycosylase G
MPAWRASNGRGAPPRARFRAQTVNGPRIPSFLKFLLFSGGLAVLVLVLLLTALRPLVRAGVVSWAWNNPSWITRVSFIQELVQEDLGDSLTQRAGSDASDALFEVQPNDTIMAIGPRLQDQGFVANQRAFEYLALTSNLQPHLQAGSFALRHNMTPSEVVIALTQGRVTLQTVNVTFREGIRLEQQTALLQTIQSGVDPKAFYDLAEHPTDELLNDYPWLEAAGLPKGASLEGFLYPATYTLVTSASGSSDYHVTTAEDLIRKELDTFYAHVGADRMKVPASRGLNFFQVVTLASIVQHETARPDEKALVAGVYQNRLDRLKGFAPLMGSEPTVIYAVDTAALAKLPFDQWKNYFFWEAIKTRIADLNVPKALQGYQTYQTPGLIPGPISTPTEIEIDAALHPDQKDGFLYFLALPNSDKNVFAHTLAEHTANIRKYYPNGFGG